MNTGYTPVQGRGFVRPGKTGKQQNWGFSGIKKAAPIRSRLSEQLTCCTKNKYEQGNYISQVTKRHNCRITGKTKATRYGGPSTQATRYPQRMSVANNATFAAGGQCAQCIGLLVGYSCSLALRRWSSSRATVTSCPISSAALTPIFSTCASASSEETRGFSPLPSAWRRAISPRMAVTMNPALLSPSSFTDSMPSKASCGIRIEICFDLSLIVFFAMCILLNKRCDSVYTKKNHKKYLTCDSVKFNLNHTSVRGCKRQRPELFAAVAGRLTTNDSRSIEAAMLNHTTHPQGRDSHNLNKYIWRFIALSTAQPRVITIEATSEQEARQQSPAGCVMVFAARIRQEVRHD
ncbi:TPA: host cell division inhibitor Icd-like protein [Escherichia coli]|nr:host cell division inhibitor Icd-like protein [Escherichia coli]